jgi:KaiC/GvpD/RAD55 family RecA-like ATPase
VLKTYPPIHFSGGYMLIRAILPDWAATASPTLRKVVEADLSSTEIQTLNEQGYNIYSLPNSPSEIPEGRPVDGTDIDQFNWVFVDMDLKDKVWNSKEEFLDHVLNTAPAATKVVDSGNGLHAYWKVSDLDALSFLRLQRRLCRYFKTDEAVSKIYQLMRTPGYANTKREDAQSPCQELFNDGFEYTCEELDKLIPGISNSDEAYCQQHFDKTYNRASATKVDDRIPVKFMHLLRSNNEVKQLWAGEVDDRSKSDYRLGHIMFGNAFTKDEARSVLVNSAKALARAPFHRINYADNIIDKIWTFEEEGPTLSLSSSVADILSRSGSAIKGTRLPCWTWLDDTEKGFRLGHVMGLVAGVGVGKTALTLNAFMGFVRNNPDYDHFFVPLEQPKEEIAERWQGMCGDDVSLHSKVQILSNYADDGSYLNLSLDEIRDYIVKYQEVTGRKVGCVVIDHIGVLKKSSSEGRQSIEDICHQMKAFAIKTNTFLIMQSQAPREKAGQGDIELDKDAAYGTVFFVSYCDYLVTLWQPLLRCYQDEGCPTITAYKFCKIRHKKENVDRIRQNKNYTLFFDTTTQLMRELTQDESRGMEFWTQKATNMRKRDKKTDLVTYTSISFNTEVPHGTASSDQKPKSATGTSRLH